ncbi:MAG: transcription antitermination factor NusB [Bacteroidia bacterium]|nr:transcription antitermination factor NusB [Bacteroidia bacterium]
MLNRRQLRVKVLQALYAFFQSGDHDLPRGERELLTGVRKSFELYFYLLTLLIELRFQAERSMEDAKTRLLPGPDDLNPNRKFTENMVIRQIASNKELERKNKEMGISWQNDAELVRKIWHNVRSSPAYEQYMNSGLRDHFEDKRFVSELLRNQVAAFEPLENAMEDKTIFWADELDFWTSMAIKSVNFFDPANPEGGPLLTLFKNEEEDKEFMLQLFRLTIIHSSAHEKLIGEKTRNWEIDRIALMDIILMKMAISELLYFPSIPVKVTLNEYIELSKMFSTPRSKVFINGILDKLVQDFRASELIKKEGRGLID